MTPGKAAKREDDLWSRRTFFKADTAFLGTALMLSRIEKYNGKINAIVVPLFEQAKARAREADKALARGETWGPLHGVPVTVKESYDVAGVPSTWGNPEFADNVPQLDATVAPVGLIQGGLPVGIQIMGPYLEDSTPIAVAGHIAEVMGGFRPPNGYHP